MGASNEKVITKVERFRALHARGCFILPNPWDVGSARLLASLGFDALATTSAGLAFAHGKPDSPRALTCDETLENIRAIVDATDLPVNADFQTGYGDTPEEVAVSVARCVETGVAGLSIEDATGDADAPLFELSLALERLAAAREAIGSTGVVLTARAECFLVGHADPLEESIRRLTAYAEAGADCLYAPGVRSDADITRVVDAVAPVPINVLAAVPERMTRAHLDALGVRRISVGSAMVRVAWRAFMRAAEEIRDGSFAPLSEAEPFATFDSLFG